MSGWVGPPSVWGGDVVDLGPCGRDGAAGDDAAAVADGDRTALVGGEAAFGRAEREDPAGVVEGDGLGAAGADHVPGCTERDRGVDAVGVCDSAPRGEVGGADADQDGGCGAADRGVFPGTGRGVDDRGEHVVALLIGGAVLTGFRRAGSILVGLESAADAG